MNWEKGDRTVNCLVASLLQLERRIKTDANNATQKRGLEMGDPKKLIWIEILL